MTDKKTLRRGILITLLLVIIFWGREIFDAIERSLFAKKLEIVLVNQDGENISSNYVELQLSFEHYFNAEKIPRRYYNAVLILPFNQDDNNFEMHISKSHQFDSVVYEVYSDTFKLGEFKTYYDLREGEKKGQLTRVGSNGVLEKSDGTYVLKFLVE